MKGNDLKIFVIVVFVSFFIGGKLYSVDYANYSDLITFLSIMIGFKITSLSILFNTPLKRTLYDRKILNYMTELHRLKDYYGFSLMFEVFSIVALFMVPKIVCSFSLRGNTVVFGKYLLILPVLLGTVFCFYKIINDLLKIFVYPINESNNL